jgi:hypothetical protein
MLSAPAPVSIDRLRPVGLRAYAPEGGLDWNDVVSGDGFFSDGNGQHTHCTTERAQGRQPKMKKSEKKVGRDLTVKLVKSLVETINCGLKICEFSACWTY